MSPPDMRKGALAGALRETVYHAEDTSQHTPHTHDLQAFRLACDFRLTLATARVVAAHAFSTGARR
jgi:hypothetical protein